MKIFFSVGEPSGDLHAANLIRQLRARRPDLEAVGFGGPEMAAAGCRLHTDLTALAVMWILRVILNIHKFLNLVSQADRYFRHHRPDAVVLVDYPGFNWWIARRAKAHGIPVFYYVPPQIWAWAGWRIKKMRRFVDHVLCSLPFEEPWFNERGCHATFIGHPYFDELNRQQLDAAFVREMTDPLRPLVAILPGSRTQEVTHNLKYFLEAAALVKQRVPQARFAVAAFKAHQAKLARQMIAESGLAIEVFVKKTPELIQAANCCMAVSGSVSLELLFQTKPTAILYWISPLAFRVQSYFRKVKYITLVNLLVADELFPADTTPRDPLSAGSEMLFPEYLTCEDKSERIAQHVTGWLTNAADRERLVEKLAVLKAQVGHGGASTAAATYILDQLDRHSQRVPRPHFIPPAAASRSVQTAKAA